MRARRWSCSDLPQLRERLGHGAGAVFAAREPDAVARALDGVIADPARGHELGAGGQEMVRGQRRPAREPPPGGCALSPARAGSEAQRPLPDAPRQTS